MHRREAIKRVALVMGGALSAPTLAGVLGGCRSGADAGGWTPQTLGEGPYETVSVLTEVILPETDTPGARAAAVPAFIDRMLTEWYPEDDRRAFLDGLTRVDARAQAAHGRAFTACTPEQQAALVAEMDRTAFAPPAPPAEPEGEVEPEMREGDVATGRSRSALSESGAVAVDGAAGQEGGQAPGQDTDSFFRTLKELTLVGYYTSEAGATEELHVAPFGPFQGDIPYEEVGREWA